MWLTSRSGPRGLLLHAALSPSCRPFLRAWSPRVPAHRRVHTGSPDPTARRHSVKVGRCPPVGPSRPPYDGASPPARLFGSRAWWSSPRQSGGPHCRPVRESLGIDDARTMGICLKQSHDLSRGDVWRWSDACRIRQKHCRVTRGALFQRTPSVVPLPHTASWCTRDCTSWLHFRPHTKQLSRTRLQSQLICTVGSRFSLVYSSSGTLRSSTSVSGSWSIPSNSRTTIPVMCVCSSGRSWG
jgi:hypothetical protein